jgi:phenylacetic acid degradation operon negative regulatory protein
MPGTQELIVSVLGRHAHPRAVALSSHTFITILDKLAITEYATRATLARMVMRDILERHVRGRQAYFAATPATTKAFEGSGRRVLEDTPVRPDANCEWTLLNFSIPEQRRDSRHRLRGSLAWHGFGRMSGGLWVAPGRVMVEPMLQRLGLTQQVKVFVGQPAAPTDMPALIDDIWDLAAKRKAYETFLDRWQHSTPPDCAGALATEILLSVEWARLVRSTPRLPSQYLPPDWPAMAAYDVFHTRFAQLRPRTTQEFLELADLIPIERKPYDGPAATPIPDSPYRRPGQA